MPIVHIDDEPAGAWRAGQTVRHVVGADQGSSSLSMQHFIVQPGSVTPLHRHDVDEVLVPLSGRIRVRMVDAWGDAGPGDLCVFPAGVPHSFVGAGDSPAEILVVFPVTDALTATHTKYLEGEPPATWS